MHVAHVTAITGQIDRSGGRLVGEEIGDSGVGEASKREAERAVPFAIHVVDEYLRKGLRVN